MELLDFYPPMVKARLFELAIADLWREGLISGEMHLGTGEEAVVAALAAHIRPDDAVALDHRPTPLLSLIGVDLGAMLREMLGLDSGLCGGWGGHMHLFAPGRRAASSGIVGAAGPAACGFGLSAKRLRPGTVALALFGDGAANQGMLLESFNLAVAWALPVIFVCKHNGWAITTRSERVTGGDLVKRAAAFGLATAAVDGLDPVAVHKAAAPLFARARGGKGPGFLHATCLRADGHFLGDPLLRMAHSPVAEGGETFGKVLSATLKRGGSGIGARAGSMVSMLGTLRQVRKEARGGKDDPIERARVALRKKRDELARTDAAMAREVDAAVIAAREELARALTARAAQDGPEARR